MHFLLKRSLLAATSTIGRAVRPSHIRPFTHLTTNHQLLPVSNRQPSHLQPPQRHLFWEPDRKAGYNKNAPRVSRKELLLEGLRDLKQEILLWKEEVQEKMTSDPVLVYRPGETDIVWDFNDPAVLQKWVASSDSDHNEGDSVCKLEPSEAGRALFSGTVHSTLPKDGKIKRAGYCNIKSMRSRVSCLWFSPSSICSN